MATIPKDVKAALIERLSGAYGHAELMCDDHRITLEVRRVSGKSLRYVVCVFVAGIWKSSWSLPDYQGPEQKFARRTEQYLHPEKDRKEMLKIAPLYGRKGSAERKKYEEQIARKWVFFIPSFPNGQAAINHLLRVSTRIAVPEKEIDHV